MGLEDARLIGPVPTVPLTERTHRDARSIGALPVGEDCSFRVWAPRASSVEVEVVSPVARIAKLKRMSDGWHEGIVPSIGAGARYFYRLDARPRRPDPASRFQPLGVHGPSEVVDWMTFPWRDSRWRGIPFERSVFFELHVGTFTPEGTFAGVTRHLDELRDLGVTTIELMPVAEFPGERNWGYDGVHPWAAQSTYGGPAELARLVDECHQRGLAVALDVVYNHLGPEGHVLDEFGPYFTERHKTPWGRAMNFDGPDSDSVRDYFIRNALWWIEDLHVDVLRVDAIHAIVDTTAKPFLAELTDVVHERARALERHVHLVAESNLNDVRVLRPTSEGGLGFDAQWNDDVHHALHAVLTGERAGRYADFGRMSQLRKAYERGFVLSGEYSQYRRRRHGSDASEIDPRRFVVFAQNHDQIGNRMFGERLSSLVGFEELKLAAGAMLLSPYVPLIFMGEEWGDTTPFLYFTSHSDARLVEAVRQGRREEFAMGWSQGHPPDPHEESTFLRSRLNRKLRSETRGRQLRELYAELLRLRRDVPALAHTSRAHLEVRAGTGDARRILWLRSQHEGSEALLILHFGREEAFAQISCLGSRRWTKLLDSSDPTWGGRGGHAPDEIAEGERTVRVAPHSFLLYG